MAIGTTWWIIAGTSTFLSVVIFVIPSERFQEFVAKSVSEHVTKYTGATVTFESAIQPTWKTLRFKDVSIKRTEESCGIKDSMEMDLTIDELDVKVSLLWMLEGKGMVEAMTVKGVRGVLDRRKVKKNRKKTKKRFADFFWNSVGMNTMRMGI
jgi:distribution and morphology protein 31